MEDLTPAMVMGAMEEGMGMTLWPLACTCQCVLLNSKFVKLAGMCYNDLQTVFHDALSIKTMHPAYSLTISSTALYVALAMTSMCSCGTFV